MSMAAALLPAPATSVVLAVFWLILVGELSAAQILLAGAFGLAVPLLTSNLRLTNVRVRRPLVVVRFILRVGCDVLLSNIEVAWGVITWQWRRPQSRFVIVPLDLRDPVGLAALSMVTTVVPGTVWSELALDRSALLLHVWDVGDEGAFVARFKARYEEPLREIFE